MKEIFSRKDIYIFGCGNRGKKCADKLRKMDFNIKGIFDNNSLMANCEYKGISVEAPAKKAGGIVIITVLNHYDEITAQLINLGYELNDIYTYENVMIWIAETEHKPLLFPDTIQLPITHLCNCDCIMCGMKHMIRRKDFKADEFGKILSDQLFSEVESVGINGGEPFMKPDIIDCVEVILEKLPKLKSLFFISNGYFTDRICNCLILIKKMCLKKGIRVNLSLSIDGIGKIHDFQRGKKQSYLNVIKTLDMIKSEKDKYVDYLDVICTVTKYNVFHLNEMIELGITKNIEIEYNVASENARIENMEKINDFDIFSDDQARMCASEFFYTRYIETGKEKYFGLFLYLTDKQRYTKCPCMYNEWITITPDGQLGFCASHSPKLGSALEKSAGNIVNGSLHCLDEIKKQYCDKCPHYGYHLNADGYSMLYRDNMRNSHTQWSEWK